MTVSRNSTDNLNNDGAVHRDTNVWQSNSSRRFGAFVPRIRLHGRLAPPDESLPVADICSSGRVSVRPIRKARISPLSKSLGRPSRKRPAWITKSPQRGDSWTRTASTAFARKPAGNYTYLRITNPPESYTLEPLSLSFSLPSSRSVNPDVFPCPGADFPFDFSSWSSSDTSLSLFRAVCSLFSFFSFFIILIIFFFFFFVTRTDSFEDNSFSYAPLSVQWMAAQDDLLSRREITNSVFYSLARQEPTGYNGGGLNTAAEI